MDHGPELRFRDIPLAAYILRKGDGLDRAKMDAHAAPFTVDLVHHKVMTDRVELATLQAFPAFGAGLQVYPGGSASLEILLMLYFRSDYYMEVSRIHITISQDLILGKGRKRGYHARLSGAPLATYDCQLFHPANSVILS
jgi:hypothetical protein